MLAALSSGDMHAASNALVGFALNGADWQEIQELRLELLEHPDEQMRALAATCLGHVARIHRRLDEDRVVPALRALRDTGLPGGAAETALEDMEIYLHHRRWRLKQLALRPVRPDHWAWLAGWRRRRAKRRW